jgi:hypothetical protein
MNLKPIKECKTSAAVFQGALKWFYSRMFK